MNCQTLNGFLLNMCKLELVRYLLSDQIWANFHRDDKEHILDIKAKPCKISNPLLKAFEGLVHLMCKEIRLLF